MKPFAWTPADGSPTTKSPATTCRAVDHAVALDDAHAGAGEVELALPVDARQLGGLAADQRHAGRATDLRRALHQLDDLVGIDLVGGDVVEQDERIRAARDDVVDAVGGGSAPQLQRRCRARTSFVPTESVDAASSRVSSSGWRPAKAPKPVAPVDSTARRSRSTIGALVDGDAGVVVRPPAHAASLFSAL